MSSLIFFPFFNWH